MFRWIRHCLPSTGLALAALASLPGHAQSAARPDPGDPRAVVPPLQHRSVLNSYRRLVDEPPLDWPGANRITERIGGWRAYLREANAPEASTGAPARAPASAPAGVAPGGTIPDRSGVVK